ncbi:outer membrane protein assembly factor BamE, partial [Salmonella enterica subsp. diarizonae]|nr:outer membrane protein assembly factor BamE [Salmonella enterica subsp. diarizonae]
NVAVGDISLDKDTGKISGLSDGSLSADSRDAVTGSQLFNTSENVTGQGVFPTPESIFLLDKGMTKDQVYSLIGRPHFDEGIYSVREWDYLLHFRTPASGTNGVTTCQLKIIYNSDKRVSGIYWRPVASKSNLCPPDAGQRKGDSRYILNSDILFGLNQHQIDKLNHNVLKNIEDIISDIREKGEYKSISVYGYTDWQGDRSYNIKLSALRAKSVADYFIANGFPKSKVIPKGMGETVTKTSCPGLKHEKLTDCLRPDRKVIIVVSR